MPPLVFEHIITIDLNFTVAPSFLPSSAPPLLLLLFLFFGGYTFILGDGIMKMLK